MRLICYFYTNEKFILSRVEFTSNQLNQNSMAIKKSELYRSLWASCDELRGSMDASQYKDYVLVLLFMKYVSDKGGALVTIPDGCSFKDFSKLKGKSNIGEQLRMKIGDFAKANDLFGIITQADFDDDEKLGKGKAKIERLSNLIAIFERPELDFSGNTAEGDDLLGDAYEFLMRHFATESGKSKGQFYTPAEVSRIMAQVIGINENTKRSDTVYDPTCGSGSLLLKVAAESPEGITIYGQEMDNPTRGLAVMNMWLHGNPTAEIVQGNTLASPEFTNKKTGALESFDFVVANPKFSDKTWTTGLDPHNDVFERFKGYDSIPPKKNGDYAYLLHFIKSMKNEKGKGAIVLPLGVLFRGNAEADIRKKIIKKKYIKGIIGLPANLFYGTGIAACIVVLDKEDAQHRNGIFMIDGSKGYIKDGNKNRLRERDIHKIVDTFNNRIPIDKYSRMIPLSEIADPKNDYNLNIPRYIDSQEPEDLQDIEAHLVGDIPTRDIDELSKYWDVYPSLKNILFIPSNRKNYLSLDIVKTEIKNTIFNYSEFVDFSKKMDDLFSEWESKTASYMKDLKKGIQPKREIKKISESLLKHYSNKPLVDEYSIFQHLMDYWAETMQDDLYELAADGWEAGNEVKRLTRKTKKGDEEIEKEITGIAGLEGRLIPPSLIIQEYFASEQAAIDDLQNKLDIVIQEKGDLIEEYDTDEGPLKDVSSRTDALKALDECTIQACSEYLNESFIEYSNLNKVFSLNQKSLIELSYNSLINSLKNNKGKITQKSIKEKLIEDIQDSDKEILKEYISVSKELSSGLNKINSVLSEVLIELKKMIDNDSEAEYLKELSIVLKYIALFDAESKLKSQIKVLLAELEVKIIEKYPSLSVDEIKIIVVDKKWINCIEIKIKAEMDNISQILALRIKELAERYETPLPKLKQSYTDLFEKVEDHLKKMNFVW